MCLQTAKGEMAGVCGRQRERHPQRPGKKACASLGDTRVLSVTGDPGGETGAEAGEAVWGLPTAPRQTGLSRMRRPE